MDIDTHEIREWNEEHYNKLARSYADSQADAITIQMLLAKAVKRLGDLFVTFGQNLTSSVGREYHDRNPAALPLVGTVQGFLPGFTSFRWATMLSRFSFSQRNTK